MTDREMFKEAIVKWGMDAQLFMAVEESAELIQSISHLRRGRATPKQVIHEVIDLEIMLGQLRVLFSDFLGIPEDDINTIRDIKMLRLKELLESNPQRKGG